MLKSIVLEGPVHNIVLYLRKQTQLNHVTSCLVIMSSSHDSNGCQKRAFCSTFVLKFLFLQIERKVAQVTHGASDV